MAAGTSVTDVKTPFKQLSGSFVIDSASLAAAAVITHTVAIPGVKIGDGIVFSPRVAMVAGAVFYQPTCLVDGTVSWVQYNPTAGAVDLASMTVDYVITRGRKGSIT